MIESVLIYSRATPHHHTGGMETLAWSLAVEWARMIKEVQVVTTSIRGADGPFTEQGVTVVPLAGTAPGEYSGAWWDSSRQHWESLTTPPSGVLSVSGGAFSIVKDRSPYPEVPFVMQAHGTAAMEIGSKLRVHDLRSLAGAAKNALNLPRDLVRYRDFDRIVAVGERVVESLVAKPQSWAAQDRVRLIPNGVRAEDHCFDPQGRAEVRAAHGITDAMTVVACVGRLHVQKGLDRAVRAAAVLRDRGLGEQFRVLLVGDGPDERRLRNLVQELQVQDMVLFAGPVDHTRVQAHYGAADVALLPTSRMEGLPMSVLEALAAGLPCIVTTDSVGSVELSTVLHQVDSSDPGLLADVLVDVTRVRPTRESLLPPNFALEKCAADYLAVFEEIESGRRG